ncbi:hypothetical protein [Nonomuraea sp. NPDC046570]|uniref:hypothetical protein n=1 Tax=Nonomuraea sp. NPDC046570 TaxID=3155255 RepID=UPI003410C962
MFKRRVVMLLAAGLLATAGLTGSAMASEDVPPAGVKAVCTTSDGKTFEVTDSVPATVIADAEGAAAVQVERIDRVEAMPAETVTPATTVSAGEMVQSGPATAGGEGVATFEIDAAAPGEGPSVTGVDGKLKAVTITCRSSK